MVEYCQSYAREQVADKHTGHIARMKTIAVATDVFVAAATSASAVTGNRLQDRSHSPDVSQIGR